MKFILLLLTLTLAAQDHARFLPARECALCQSRIPQSGGTWQDQAGWVGPSQL